MSADGLTYESNNLQLYRIFFRVEIIVMAI